jgi:hypothetical protein
VEPDERPRADHGDVLSPARLLRYAELWRRLAREWTEMADNYAPELAAKFRRTAHAALHAANEVDDLLKARERIAAETHKPPLSH